MQRVARKYRGLSKKVTCVCLPLAVAVSCSAVQKGEGDMWLKLDINKTVTSENGSKILDKL